MPRRPAIVLEFRLRDVFVPDDPLAVPLLRLMAATNDARYLQKLLVSTGRDEATNQGPADGLIHEGELSYLFRVLCGHLFEAGLALRGLDGDSANRMDALVGDSEIGRAALAHLRAVYGDLSEDGFNRKVLNRLRTFGAFHYKDKVFRDGLDGGPETAATVAADWPGLARYVVTDSMISRVVVADSVGLSQDDFIRAAAQAIELARHLSVAVDHLVLGLLEEAAGASVRKTATSVKVPTALQTAMRERLDRGRTEESSS